MRTLLLFIGLLPLSLLAQTDTAMVEQYCQVTLHSPLFSGKFIITVDKGDQKVVDENNFVRDKEGKPMRFNTVVAALNYMGSQGWALVTIYPSHTTANTPSYYYLFKRLAKKQERTE